MIQILLFTQCKPSLRSSSKHSWKLIEPDLKSLDPTKLKFFLHWRSVSFVTDTAEVRIFLQQLRKGDVNKKRARMKIFKKYFWREAWAVEMSICNRIRVGAAQTSQLNCFHFVSFFTVGLLFAFEKGLSLPSTEIIVVRSTQLKQNLIISELNNCECNWWTPHRS